MMDYPVLMIERDPETTKDLSEVLQEGGYHPVATTSLSQALACLQDMKIKAIIQSDIGSLQEQIDFIKEIKGGDSTKWIPLIIHSESNNDAFRIECFNSGADDFLQKPVNPKELLARVKGLINKIGNFEEMAFRDPLTKAYNRRYFDHQVFLEIQRAQRNGYPLSIAFIDADKFKSINDTYGHHVGDLVLQGLSAKLQQQLRSSDIVARYGGEEFVVLLPTMTGEQATEKMHSILEVVRTHPIATHESQAYYITFSCGVSEWKVGMNVSEWIRLADEGVYAAKEQGRNRVIHVTLKDDNPAGHETPKKVIVIGSPEVAKFLKSNPYGLSFDVLELEINQVSNQNDADLCVVTISKEVDDVAVETLRQEKLAALGKVLAINEGYSEYEVFKQLAAGVNEVLRSPYTEIDLEISLKRVLETN